MNNSKLKYLIAIFLTSGVLTNLCWANSFPWPEWTQGTYTTRYVFAPERLEGFIAHQGIVNIPESDPNPTKFIYLDLGQKWNHPNKCGDATRPSGYIHTQTIHSSREEHIQVGFPVKLKIDGILDSAKAQVSHWPLFRIYILTMERNQLDKIYSGVQLRYGFVNFFKGNSGLHEGFFQTIGHMMNHHTNFINFEGAFISEPFDLKLDQEYQVRIEWHSDGICGEGPDGFHLEVGDQIRLLVARH